MRAIIGRWGRSLAVRLPVELAAEAGLSEGQRIELVAVDGEIVIRPTQIPIDVDTLFEGRSAEEWRALYRGSYDWGPDVGREVTEE
ncbi:AbrB/MazE/SpoVT family DNA-binding domain-containing protein [Enterovirga rhinocerotis]|uniref:Antitoxin MazE n=1 Tax=Enterovirga rhinocerotis TaxID=1339210 RepID=A0A4R7CDG7_9HYPH|nr:AbrB/MazE/SpoVT family DNA-binding domain-containing protein [Enterovirga rhinocerotis]TDR94877.1 antitoxin MazE [Enterovirga rhinocerotis]